MNARAIKPIHDDLMQIKSIIRAVALKWGIDTKILLGRSRKQPEAFARQLCMALAYQKTNFSLVQVGECFGNRDHATVLHAIKRVNEASNNKEVAPVIMEVIEEIKTKTNT